MVSNYHLHPSLLQQPLGEELVIDGVGAQVEGDEVFIQQPSDVALVTNGVVIFIVAGLVFVRDYAKIIIILL